LDEFLSSDLGLTSAYGHQVTVTGQYVDEPQLLADPDAPHRIVSAFELHDGTVLAIVRGATDAGEVSVPPTGEVQLEGILLDTDPEGPR
ncbi:hypothetical protein NPM03_33075, partial [Bacillus cereus]|uniref:SURF1 family cytochrome oxidase biogenesis protein n=1 Tax=Bacillus cereus TaxID=1396 RepID=UPI0021127F69